MSEQNMENPKTAREAQQRKEEKRSNRLYAIIGIVFVVVAAAAILSRANLGARFSPAAEIDGQKYSAGEVEFYYSSVYQSFMSNWSYMLEYLGLDSSRDPAEQTVSESAADLVGAEVGTSWKDYFLNESLKQMAIIQSGMKQAASEGFTFSDSVKAQCESAMDSLKGAATSSGMNAGQYLQAAYGSNVTEKIYQQEVTRIIQFSEYTAAYQKNLTYSDSDVQAAYQADTKLYDRVSYEGVAVNGTAPTVKDNDGNTVEPTEAESAAAMEAAKKAADEMLVAYKAGADLSKLAEADEKATYSKNPAATYYGTAVTEWLFDDARKANDSVVLESGSAYYVLVFHDRYLDQTPTIDVRHILVGLEDSELAITDEGYEEEEARLKAEALSAAEDILAQWKSGEATEASFAALAAEHSTDPGSASNGGLYTSVEPGQMIDTFNDWCFDTARKPGDTGVVETPYGAHVMYFVDHGDPIWKTTIENDLRAADYNEWMETLASNTSYSLSSGAKYVG